MRDMEKTGIRFQNIIKGLNFTIGSACIIQNTINLTLITQTAVKNQHTLQTLTPLNMDGETLLWLCLAYERNHGIPVRIARYHNIFGPEGARRWKREGTSQSCRQVAYLPEMGGAMEVWGDGLRTRSVH